MRKSKSRIETSTSSISALINGISNGEIKIPKFQRQFVWKENQALDLLDSIAKDYPSGSLLIWKTKTKLRAERNIGEFNLPITDDYDPTDYILDGQQRLTVIYSCLGADEDQGGFSVAYDLEEEKFMRMPDNLSIHHFPLRKIFNTTKLLNFRQAILADKKSHVYQDRLDQIVSAFTEYRLPVVTLKDLSIEEVCPIFERINSSGTKLSTYDLMVAATWTNDFDLNDEVEEIRESLRPKGFEDIDRETVLKCISAIKLGTIKEQSLKTLRTLNKSEMQNLIERTKIALLHAVDLLSTEFKIYSWSFLSYEALVVIICHIYSKTNHLEHEQIHRVKQWFWRSSFGERYKVGGENFVSNDLEIVYRYVIDGVGAPEDFGQAPTEKEWMSVSFRSNVSRSRAYIIALAKNGPRNITNGSIIDNAEALSVYNRKQFHHVYPRAFLKRARISNDNLLLNIIMLSAIANNNISDSDPNLYLPELAKNLGSEADNVFESNLLPKPSCFDYILSSYEEFLQERCVIVSKFVENLCNGGK